MSTGEGRGTGELSQRVSVERVPSCTTVSHLGRFLSDPPERPHARGGLLHVPGGGERDGTRLAGGRARGGHVAHGPRCGGLRLGLEHSEVARHRLLSLDAVPIGGRVSRLGWRTVVAHSVGRSGTSDNGRGRSRTLRCAACSAGSCPSRTPATLAAGSAQGCCWSSVSRETPPCGGSTSCGARRVPRGPLRPRTRPAAGRRRRATRPTRCGTETWRRSRRPCRCSGRRCWTSSSAGTRATAAR